MRPSRCCARSGAATRSSTCPTWTSATRDAAFVPFFGVPAATLLAPSRLARALNMVVQPVVAEMLPGGQGYRVRFHARRGATSRATTRSPTRARMNRWIEERDPAQPGAVPVGAQALQDAAAGRAARCTSAADARRRRDNRRMRLRFTKMQGAGNDFVVLDATRAPLDARRRADARAWPTGTSASAPTRSSSVEPRADAGRRLPLPDLQRRSGDEVEQCGNGARCFVRFVRDKGLTDKTTIRVRDA